MLIIAILAVLAIGLGVSAATEPEINIRYGNITRSGGYVSLGYAVEYTGIPSTAEHGLLVWRATPDSRYLKGREDELIISDNRISIDGKGYYKFTVTDIAEMEITDDVYTVAYARVGTKIYYSEVNKHSPLRYAYIAEGKIGDDPVNDEQVLAFLANMIKKGADAQRSENYKTDRLADADYVELEIEGGLFADGTEKGLYIPDTEVAVIGDVARRSSAIPTSARRSGLRSPHRERASFDTLSQGLNRDPGALPWVARAMVRLHQGTAAWLSSQRLRAR